MNRYELSGVNYLIKTNTYGEWVKYEDIKHVVADNKTLTGMLHDADREQIALEALLLEGRKFKVSLQQEIVRLKGLLDKHGGKEGLWL